MMQEILESKSLWYKYKTQVWYQETQEAAVVHNIMRVLRSIRNWGNLAYVTVPITSGRFFYELKLRKPLMNEKIRLEKAIKHNYKIGWDLVEEVTKRRKCPVLYPADLVPARQHWEDDHFQALWMSIIAEKCTEHHMSEGWEYSSGSSEEFTHTMQLKLGLPSGDIFFWNTKEDLDKERERMRSILVYDHKGNPLSLNDGYGAIEKALRWIQEQGFGLTSKRVIRLQQCLQLLGWTGKMIEQGFYQ